MSNMRDAPILKAVADVVKDHVGKAFVALRGRVDGIEQRIKELPTPERGDKGDPGDSGTVGPPGVPGQKGLDGRDGDAGIQGLAGNDGKEGAQGLRGEIGPVGPIGERGAAGLGGKDGIEGKQGDKGLDGANGKDGRNGIDGKDAPPIDTKALTGEIVETVLKQIPAPVHGKDGRDGKDAEQLDVNDIVSKILGQIPPPIPGKDGKDVDLDAVRILITSEVTKAIDSLPAPKAGRDGRDGRAGDTGISGRDAPDIDILEGIDELASYQRGTYAHHRGGLLKAYRTTDPVHAKDFGAAGWQVIHEGIADAGSALSADERTVVQSIELTSGKLLTSKYEIPTLIHKGAWKSDQEYRKGDFATSAGSTWHCNELTKDRPGVSKSWTLVVKRGSDGKDATLNGAHQ